MTVWTDAWRNVTNWSMELTKTSSTSITTWEANPIEQKTLISETFKGPGITLNSIFTIKDKIQESAEVLTVIYQ